MKLCVMHFEAIDDDCIIGKRVLLDRYLPKIAPHPPSVSHGVEIETIGLWELFNK